MRGVSDLYAELAEIVGADGVRTLRDAFAGCQIYVPRNPGDSHPIRVALGDKADLFCSYYHGTIVQFPLTTAKRQQVLDLSAAGKSNAQIARALWISERYVRMILSQERKLAQNSRQLNLL